MIWPILGSVWWSESKGYNAEILKSIIWVFHSIHRKGWQMILKIHKNLLCTSSMADITMDIYCNYGDITMEKLEWIHADSIQFQNKNKHCKYFLCCNLTFLGCWAWCATEDCSLTCFVRWCNFPASNYWLLLERTSHNYFWQHDLSGWGPGADLPSLKYCRTWSHRGCTLLATVSRGRWKSLVNEM